MCSFQSTMYSYISIYLLCYALILSINNCAVVIGVDIIDEQLVLSQILTDFVGALLLKPCLHFHLQLDAKLKNINNNIILSIQSTNNRTIEETTTGGSNTCLGSTSKSTTSISNDNKDNNATNRKVDAEHHLRFGRTSSEAGKLLNFGFDEYTNSLVELCLYKSTPTTTAGATDSGTAAAATGASIPLSERCVNVEAKICIDDLMTDLRILRSRMHQAVSDITGMSK